MVNLIMVETVVNMLTLFGTGVSTLLVVMAPDADELFFSWYGKVSNNTSMRWFRIVRISERSPVRTSHIATRLLIIKNNIY